MSRWGGRFDGPYPGYPPLPEDEDDSKKVYVVLIGRFGWITGRWDGRRRMFKDIEQGLPDHLSYHHRDDIEWWMPQSGSMKY